LTSVGEVQRVLDIDLELFRPFGTTGARITATLLNNLTIYDKTFGLETMCVGGSQGMAMVIERLS
jgi:acetyl-CoA C-acetyltransferase